MRIQRALLMAAIAAAGATACAGGPHAPSAVTPLAAVDTAWYVVPGSSRAEWAVNLPRAAAAAGIPGGRASWTVGHVLFRMSGTRTTSTGCEVQGPVLLLRLGHVMPKLAPGAQPDAVERAAWDSFMQRLWAAAREREVVGAKVADELRSDMKHTRTMQCSELLVQNRDKLDAFSARYTEALRKDEAERRAGGSGSPSSGGADIP